MEAAETFSTDSEMTNVGVESDSNKTTRVVAADQADIKEAVVVLDKWSRTCDIVLNSLDEQIKKISKKAAK